MIDWDLSLSLKNTSIGSVNTIPLPNKKITDPDKRVPNLLLLWKFQFKCQKALLYFKALNVLFSFIKDTILCFTWKLDILHVLCFQWTKQKESFVFFFKDLFSVADSLSTKALVTYVPSSRPITCSDVWFRK